MKVDVAYGKWGEIVAVRKHIAPDLINAGACYLCNKSVFASEGQAIKYYKDRPTHKACRKQKIS